MTASSTWTKKRDADARYRTTIAANVAAAAIDIRRSPVLSLGIEPMLPHLRRALGCLDQRVRPDGEAAHRANPGRRGVEPGARARKEAKVGEVLADRDVG